MKTISLSVLALFLLAAPTFAQMAPAKIADTSKGKSLVDDKGMTLYVFDQGHDRQIDLLRPMR